MTPRRGLALGALASALVGALSTPGRAGAQAAAPDADPFAAAAIEPRPAAPFAAWSASASTMRDSLVALARAQIGRRYRTGGQTPDGGFDCSGLVRYVMTALRVPVPRTASQQAHVGSEIVRESGALRPGDLVTFGSERRISHIGIYVGEGRFVHASTTAGRVIESQLERPLYRTMKPWRGARRVIVTGDSAVIVPRG